MRAWLTRFWSDERGLETIEYAIMVALIVAGLVVVVTAIGAWVLLQFTNLQNDLPGA